MVFQPPKKRNTLDQGKRVSLKLFISIVLAVYATTLAAAEIAKVTDSQSSDVVIPNANIPELLTIVASVAAKNDRPDATRGDGYLRYVGLGFAHGSSSIDCRDCGDPSPSD